MDHHYYMKRCLQLASQGLFGARPNPMVGSVIVYNETIIGEGFHQQYGEAHAEVNAVNSVVNKELLKEATIYVSLEPCAHYGKTPPCADLIIKNQIPKVVISCVDTFSEVAGKGIQRLNDAGVEVITGILEREGRELNKRFFCFHEKKRPYITLKWAQTSDGFIDKLRTPGETGVNWISSAQSKQLVHKWRTEEMGILVGYNTWINDQPTLNVREWSGPDPKRIVWYSKPASSKPANLTLDDLFITGDIHTLLNECYLKGIQSILVEGGAKTIDQFLSTDLWDEARVFTGQTFFTAGLEAPEIKAAGKSEKLGCGDLLTTYIR